MGLTHNVFLRHFASICMGLILTVSPGYGQTNLTPTFLPKSDRQDNLPQNSNTQNSNNISPKSSDNNQQTIDQVENQKIIEEMITPIELAGVPKAPFLVSQERAKIAAEKLYLSVQTVLATEDAKLSFVQVNSTFDAYNSLIVLLGLTESAQIENFPRLKSIGLALGALRDKIAVVKSK
jgi:hypothetical protein